MFESFGDSLQKHTSGRLGLQDARHVLQHLIKEKLQTEDVYCVSVNSTEAIVRVPSALLKQELLLWQPDILYEFTEITGEKLRKLTIQR